MCLDTGGEIVENTGAYEEFIMVLEMLENFKMLYLPPLR